MTNAKKLFDKRQSRLVLLHEPVFQRRGAETLFKNARIWYIIDRKILTFEA